MGVQWVPSVHWHQWQWMKSLALTNNEHSTLSKCGAPMGRAGLLKPRKSSILTSPTGCPHILNVFSQNLFCLELWTPHSVGTFGTLFVMTMVGLTPVPAILPLSSGFAHKSSVAMSSLHMHPHLWILLTCQHDRSLLWVCHPAAFFLILFAEKESVLSHMLALFKVLIRPFKSNDKTKLKSCRNVTWQECTEISIVTHFLSADKIGD